MKKMKLKKIITKRGWFLQANHMIVGVTGNMEPSTGINQSRVPTLQHVVGVRKPASQIMQSISCTTKAKKSKSCQKQIRTKENKRAKSFRSNNK